MESEKLHDAGMFNFLIRTGKREKLKRVLTTKTQASLGWDEDGFSPLSIAVSCNDLDIVTMLLEHGCDPNERNENGTTALSEVSSVEICQALLNAGALVAREAPSDGNTSVHNAVIMGYERVLKMLLKVDGKTALTIFADGLYTPLHLAVCHSQESCARILLEAGADPNLSGLSDSEYSAIQYAVKRCSLPFLEMLQSRGGELTMSDLQTAEAYCKGEIISYVKEL